MLHSQYLAIIWKRGRQSQDWKSMHSCCSGNYIIRTNKGSCKTIHDGDLSLIRSTARPKSLDDPDINIFGQGPNEFIKISWPDIIFKYQIVFIYIFNEGSRILLLVCNQYLINTLDNLKRYLRIKYTPWLCYVMFKFNCK